MWVAMNGRGRGRAAASRQGGKALTLSDIGFRGGMIHSVQLNSAEFNHDSLKVHSVEVTEVGFRAGFNVEVIQRLFWGHLLFGMFLLCAVNLTVSPHSKPD